MKSFVVAVIERTFLENSARVKSERFLDINVTSDKSVAVEWWMKHRVDYMDGDKGDWYILFDNHESYCTKFGDEWGELKFPTKEIEVSIKEVDF